MGNRPSFSNPIGGDVEKDISVPIVSIIYDGTNSNKNELLAPYLHYCLQPVGE